MWVKSTIFLRLFKAFVLSIEIINVFAIIALIYFSVVATTVTIDINGSYRTVCMLKYKGEECSSCCITHYIFCASFCLMFLINLVCNSAGYFKWCQTQRRMLIIRYIIVISAIIGLSMSIAYLVILIGYISNTCEYVESKASVICLASVILADRGRDLVLISMDIMKIVHIALIPVFCAQLIAIGIAVYIEKKFKEE